MTSKQMSKALRAFNRLLVAITRLDVSVKTRDRLFQLAVAYNEAENDYGRSIIESFESVVSNVTPK